MTYVRFSFTLGQAVRHRTTGEEGNVLSRDTHWYRGNAYKLRFVGSKYMSPYWYPEDELVAIRPPYSGPQSDQGFVEDVAEFNAGLPDTYEDAKGG